MILPEIRTFHVLIWSLAIIWLLWRILAISSPGPEAPPPLNFQHPTTPEAVPAGDG
jgi:hypothetical protein